MQEWFVRVDPLGAYMGPFPTREDAQGFITEKAPQLKACRLSIVAPEEGGDAAIAREMSRATAA